MLIEFLGFCMVFMAGVLFGFAHGYARGVRSEFDRLYDIRRQYVV